MNRRWDLRRARMGLLVLSVVGCATDFDPAWLIKHYRVFGARIENITRMPTDPGAVEGAPGERMHLSLVQWDPTVPQRTIETVWVFCATPMVMGNTFGCGGASPVIATGTDVDYVIPPRGFGVGSTYNPTVTALSYSCAGGSITVTPGDPVPRCVGVGAEGWLMTRTITVRTSETVPINHLPAIADVVLYPGVDATEAPVSLDPMNPVHVPRCVAGTPCARHLLEIRPASDAREHYLGYNAAAQQVDLVELLQFSFATTGGTLDALFRVDTAQIPDGPIRDTWTVPSTPGPVTLVLTAQDTRGGFDDALRTILVD